VHYNFMRVTRKLPFVISVIFIAGGMSVASAYILMAPPKPWVASSRYARKVNPVEVTPASIAAGAKVYKAQCLACHGKEGHGDGIRAAELKPRPHNIAIPEMWLQTDGELFYKIGKGNTPMPSFKKIITTQEIWQVINYVRKLAPKPTVLGYRFDIGEASRAAMGKVVKAATRVSSALAATDSDSSESALADLTQAADGLASVTITSQDKYIVRGWKSVVSGLASKAHALQSASDESSRSAALTRFSTILNYALRLFGGVESGVLYQFEIPATDSSAASLTWFQSEAAPKPPFHSEGSSIPSIVSVFGPHTSIDK